MRRSGGNRGEVRKHILLWGLGPARVETKKQFNVKSVTVPYINKALAQWNRSVAFWPVKGSKNLLLKASTRIVMMYKHYKAADRNGEVLITHTHVT